MSHSVALEKRCAWFIEQSGGGLLFPDLREPFLWLFRAPGSGMPKVKTNRVKYPEGWELIEPTLRELQAKMREGVNFLIQ